MSKKSQYPNKDYTVAWVCALPVELTAARQALDEIHGTPQHQNPSDENSYVLGAIDGHKVAVACLPAGAIGNNPAAVLATNMKASFPSLRFGLLVGVGGGIPSKVNDIRLGDVVVSQPADDHGGVVQFDMGKELIHGEFKRTGMLNRPPAVLLNAVNALKAREDDEGSQILNIYDEMLEKLRSRVRSKYARPPDDKLYEEDYDHSDPDHPTCENCNDRFLIHRPQRCEEEKVRVHYGIIASANVVVRNPKRRENLRKAFGALCVEMEAAGLMNTFPCLVIRGICDYADSHKNKAWQPNAAMVAAAYTKELLHVIPPASVLREKTAAETMDEIKGELKKALKNELENYKREHGIDQFAIIPKEVYDAKTPTKSKKEKKTIKPNPKAPLKKQRPPTPNYARDDDDGIHSLDEEDNGTEDTPPPSPPPPYSPQQKRVQPSPSPSLTGETFPPAAGDTTTVHAWVTVQQKRGHLFLSKFRAKRKYAAVYELSRSSISMPVFETKKVDDVIGSSDTEPYEPNRKAAPLDNLLKGNSFAQIEIEDSNGKAGDETVVLLGSNLLKAEQKSPYQGIWSAILLESTKIGSKSQFFLFHQPSDCRLDIYSITGGKWNPRGQLYGYADITPGVHSKDRKIIANIVNPDDDEDEWLEVDMVFVEDGVISIDDTIFTRVDVLSQLSQ